MTEAHTFCEDAVRDEADRMSALEAALAKADELAEASDVSSNYIDGGSCIGACEAYADLVDASIAYRQARDATR